MTHLSTNGCATKIMISPYAQSQREIEDILRYSLPPPKQTNRLCPSQMISHLNSNNAQVQKSFATFREFQIKRCGKMNSVPSGKNWMAEMGSEFRRG